MQQLRTNDTAMLRLETAKFIAYARAFFIRMVTQAYMVSVHSNLDGIYTLYILFGFYADCDPRDFVVMLTLPLY